LFTPRTSFWPEAFAWSLRHPFVALRPPVAANAVSVIAPMIAATTQSPMSVLTTVVIFCAIRCSLSGPR